MAHDNSNILNGMDILLIRPLTQLRLHHTEEGVKYSKQFDLCSTNPY